MFRLVQLRHVERVDIVLVVIVRLIPVGPSLVTLERLVDTRALFILQVLRLKAVDRSPYIRAHCFDFGADNVIFEVNLFLVCSKTLDPLPLLVIELLSVGQFFGERIEVKDTPGRDAPSRRCP